MSHQYSSLKVDGVALVPKGSVWNVSVNFGVTAVLHSVAATAKATRCCCSPHRVDLRTRRDDVRLHELLGGSKRPGSQLLGDCASLGRLRRDAHHGGLGLHELLVGRAARGLGIRQQLELLSPVPDLTVLRVGHISART